MFLYPLRWPVICIQQRQHRMQNFCHLDTWWAYIEGVGFFLSFLFLCEDLPILATLSSPPPVLPAYNALFATPNIISCLHLFRRPPRKYKMLKDKRGDCTSRRAVNSDDVAVFKESTCIGRPCSLVDRVSGNTTWIRHGTVQADRGNTRIDNPAASSWPVHLLGQTCRDFS